MATYYLTSLTKQQLWKRSRSGVFWGLGLIVCSFLAGAMTVTHHPNGADKLGLFLGIPPFVIGVQLLQGALAQYKNSKKRYRFEIKVDELGILRRAPNVEDLFLPRSEIIGFTEQKNGALAIRTDERQRFIYAPKDLDDLPALRQELLLLNICPIDLPKADRLKSVVLFAGILVSVAGWGFSTNKLAITIGGIFLIGLFVYGYISIKKNPNVPHKRSFPIYVAFCVLFMIVRIAMAWH